MSIHITLPAKRCDYCGANPGVPHKAFCKRPYVPTLGEWKDDPQTRASTIIEFVRELSDRNSNHSLGTTVLNAYGHELFVWWHEAQALMEIEREPWAKKLAAAVAATIASECVKRCANKGPSIDDAPSPTG